MNEGGGEAMIENLELQQYGTETENPTATCIVGFGFGLNQWFI